MPSFRKRLFLKVIPNGDNGPLRWNPKITKSSAIQKWFFFWQIFPCSPTQPDPHHTFLGTVLHYCNDNVFIFSDLFKRHVWYSTNTCLVITLLIDRNSVYGHLGNQVFRWPGASLCIQITSFMIWRPNGFQEIIFDAKQRGEYLGGDLSCFRETSTYGLIKLLRRHDPTKKKTMTMTILKKQS